MICGRRRGGRCITSAKSATPKGPAHVPKGVAWRGGRAAGREVSPDGRRVGPHRYERTLSTVSGKCHAPEAFLPRDVARATAGLLMLIGSGINPIARVTQLRRSSDRKSVV